MKIYLIVGITQDVYITQDGSYTNYEDADQRLSELEEKTNRIQWEMEIVDVPHKIFELRACWEEHYDCPDNGYTKICDTYETIAFSYDKTKLETIAADLRLGHTGNNWSKSRSDKLRKLYSAYDDMRDTKYEVVDVSDLVI